MSYPFTFFLRRKGFKVQKCQARYTRSQVYTNSECQTSICYVPFSKAYIT